MVSLLIEEAEKITKDAGLDVYNQIKGIQPICFENACWAYITGAAIAIKKGCRKAADAAAAIGEGLQAFCIPGSVADTRKVGLGHGNLGKMLLEEETECFAFLAGHESFAAAEGAIGIAEKANKVRTEAAARYPERSWKRRCTDHLPYQRLYLSLRLSMIRTPTTVKEVFQKVLLRRDFVQRLTATAQTAFRKVLQSCGRKT